MRVQKEIKETSPSDPIYDALRHIRSVYVEAVMDLEEKVRLSSKQKI